MEASGEGIAGEGSARPGCSTTASAYSTALFYTVQLNLIKQNDFLCFLAVDIPD